MQPAVCTYAVNTIIHSFRCYILSHTEIDKYFLHIIYYFTVEVYITTNLEHIGEVGCIVFQHEMSNKVIVKE